MKAVSIHTADPASWADVGCGTGTLVERAYDLFPATRFILADPAPAMLELARRKLLGKDRARILDPVTAERLAITDSVDVISAIQALHYLDADGRTRAIRNCFRLLKEGGIFVTFENIRPLTERGAQIGKAAWCQYEVAAGKPVEEARRHVERYGVEFFPITIEQHLKVLREAGFATVELLWYSCVQAGFYGIK